MKKIVINNKEIEMEILYHLENKIGDNVDELTEENIKVIEELNLNYIENEDYSFLKYFINLKKIELDNTKLKSIDFLKVLPYLEEISILNNEVEDINVLEHFKNLKVLDIRYNNISNIDVLKNLKNLELLYLRGNEIESLKPIKDANLKKICICKMNLSQEDCDVISSFMELEEVCGHDAKINGKLKLNSKVREVGFYRVDTSLVDFSSLENVYSLQVPEDRVLRDFTHISKLLSIHISSIDLEDDLKLLEEFINKKDLQFLHINNSDITMEEFRMLSKFKSLKITTNNDTITSYVILKDELRNWHINSFDNKDIDKVYCQDYIEHFVAYIYEREEFTSHILYLKKLYLMSRLAYEDTYNNYIPFGRVEHIYKEYLNENKNTMTSYQRAKFKEFYAFLISNKYYDNVQEENKEIIRCLEQSLKEYKSEFVYYKLMYYCLKNEEYEKAFKYFKIIDNKYDYNYYVGYYELIMMKKFGASIDLQIDTIEYFLNSFKVFSNIEMELIYNFVLFEYLKIQSNSIKLTYDDVEPIIVKDQVEIMVKNRVYDKISTMIDGSQNIDEVYNNLMSKKEIQEVVKRYDDQFIKASNSKLMINDIIDYKLLKRGRWEEQRPD